MQNKSKLIKKYLDLVFISKNGIVIDCKSEKILKICNRGYFTIDKKKYNLPKIMMLLFRNEAIKNGRIVFLNNDINDYSIDNIKYKSNVKKEIKPDRKLIIKLIRYYYPEPNIININDVYKFRMQMELIAKIRNEFTDNIDLIKNDVITKYLTAPYPSIYLISKMTGLSVSDTRNYVYNFINNMIQNCIVENKISP